MEPCEESSYYPQTDSKKLKGLFVQVEPTKYIKTWQYKVDVKSHIKMKG